MNFDSLINFIQTAHLLYAIVGNVVILYVLVLVCRRNKAKIFSFIDSRRRQARIAGAVAISLGICLAVASGLWALHTNKFVRRAVATNGEVVRLDYSKPSLADHNSGGTYYPVFSFHDASGQSHTVRETVGQNPPTHQVGDKVVVLYLQDNPEDASIRSFQTLWLPQIATGIFGIIFILIGSWAMIVASRNCVDSESQTPPTKPEEETMPKSDGIKKTSNFAIVFGVIIFGAVGAAALGFVMMNKTKTQTTEHPAVANVESNLTFAAHKTTNALWTLDLSKTQFPDQTAAGKFRSNDFTVERAILKDGTLNIHQGTGTAECAFVINFHLMDGEDINGKSYQVAASDISSLPQISMTWREDNRKKPETQTFTSGYVMKLEFGNRTKNKISAKIYLCLPDMQKSCVAGNLEITIRKDKN